MVAGSLVLTPTTVTLIGDNGVAVLGDQAVVGGTLRITLTPGTVALGDFVPLVTASGGNTTLQVDSSVRIEVVSGTPEADRNCERVEAEGQRQGQSYGVVFAVDGSQCSSSSSSDHTTTAIVSAIVPVAVCLCVTCAVCLVLALAGGIGYRWVRPLLWANEAPERLDSVVATH